MRNNFIRILCCLVLVAVIVPLVTIPAEAARKAPIRATRDSSKDIKTAEDTQEDAKPAKDIKAAENNTKTAKPAKDQTAPPWEKPAERYQWAYSGGGQNFQFDTYTLQKINDPYRDEQLVEAWVRVITPDGTASGNIVLQQYYFRLNVKQIQLMGSFDMHSDGQVGPGNKFTYAAHRWQDIIPGTAPEGIYNAVTAYAAVKFPPPKEKGKFLGIF